MADLNTKLGTKIFKINQFFSRPIGIITAIGLMALFIFIYFALEHKALLGQIKQIAQENQEINKNLEQVVADLKADNAHQTDLIICLLAVHSEASVITEVEEESCERVVAETEQLMSSGSLQTNPPNQPTNNPPKNPPNNPPDDPEDPPDPPQSILPIVDEPIVGCTLGVCV